MNRETAANAKLETRSTAVIWGKENIATDLRVGVTGEDGREEERKVGIGKHALRPFIRWLVLTNN